MPIDFAALYRLIVETAFREELSLRAVGSGIFLMPERAFVYAVGKAIASQPTPIFGSSSVSWSLEKNLGNGGPSDLVCDTNGGLNLVVEFKMTGIPNTYVSDLQKLTALPSNQYERCFCALVNPWPDTLATDSRVGAVESYIPSDGSRVVRVQDPFEFFSTWDRPIRKQLCCLIGLWRLIP